MSAEPPTSKSYLPSGSVLLRVADIPLISIVEAFVEADLIGILIFPSLTVVLPNSRSPAVTLTSASSNTRALVKPRLSRLTLRVIY